MIANSGNIPKQQADMDTSSVPTALRDTAYSDPSPVAAGRALRTIVGLGWSRRASPAATVRRLLLLLAQVGRRGALPDVWLGRPLESGSLCRAEGPCPLPMR